MIAVSYACIEEYIPPSVKIKSNRYLTVNGTLYSDDSIKSIILSRTLDAWEPDTLYALVNNAQVNIIDDMENIVTFYESEDGIYQSLFDPQYERTYQLHIIEESGEEYISEHVKMEITPDIDSIYWEMNNNPVSEGEGNQGLEIMIATHDDLKRSSYYKWDWSETWEIRTPYKAYLKYVDGKVVPTNEIPDFCWVDNSTTDIVIGNTESLSRNQIVNKVIHKIPFTHNKLHIRYSIQVRQYAMDKKAYKYWDNLKNSNETSGSLFDSQPVEIRSNIININDSQEPVMGYFDIYRIKKKRIFIDRDEIPIIRGISSGYFHCDDPDSISLDKIEEYTIRGYNILAALRFAQDTIGWVVLNQECSDCRTKGKEFKPAFWEPK